MVPVAAPGTVKVQLFVSLTIALYRMIRMRVLVNGVHLYFDVDGCALRTNGDQMQELPTLLLLHGGPGIDHSLYKPVFSALTNVAQVVYLDHRGNGRSERGSPDSWNLAQWAD